MSLDKFHTISCSPHQAKMARDLMDDLCIDLEDFMDQALGLLAFAFDELMLKRIICTVNTKGEADVFVRPAFRNFMKIEELGAYSIGETVEEGQEKEILGQWRIPYDKEYILDELRDKFQFQDYDELFREMLLLQCWACRAVQKDDEFVSWDYKKEVMYIPNIPWLDFLKPYHPDPTPQGGSSPASKLH